MSRFVKRSSDGETIDIEEALAESYDKTNKALKTTATVNVGDIEIGAVEIKNAADDTRAVVKSDGTNNALVVVQNTVPSTTVTATHLDIRHLNSTDDAVNVGTVTTLPSITGTVTANAGSNLNTSALATSANQQPPSTTPTVYNVTLTNANTEYSQALPANTREFRFRCRTTFDIRYTFVTGKVATPTEPYLTLPSGSDYFGDWTNLTSVTIYFASSTAGVVVELEVWT
jgi:hypothetical protein